MKKLMIALAAVAMAVGANAASINWSTPILYSATADGTFSDTLLKNAGASAFSVALTFYTADGTQIAGVGNASKGTFSKNGSVSNTTTGYDFVFGTEYKYSAHYTYNDGSKEWTMDVGPTAFTQSAGTGNYTLSVPTADKWTGAPEPTSAMLMLLGMAGLALRRRRA